MVRMGCCGGWRPCVICIEGSPDIDRERNLCNYLVYARVGGITLYSMGGPSRTERGVSELLLPQHRESRLSKTKQHRTAMITLMIRTLLKSFIAENDMKDLDCERTIRKG